MNVTVHPDELRRYGSAILSAAGLPEPDADVVAGSLVDANLRGTDSHGVSRIPIYVERIRRGIVEPHPQIRVISESGGALIVDGGNGMGAVVTSKAMEIALDRLGKQRSISVAIRNSNHYASGSYYAKPALARGAATFLYSNAPATMSPWGGSRRFLGTNPYTFAIPAGRYGPLVLDMATSVVARGKIIQAAQRGESIPAGWAVDAEGRPTTDPQAALAGSVIPFGGPKGYGIAMMVEVMAGVLTGANIGPDVGDLYENLQQPQNVGAFLQVLDISAFLPHEQFVARVEEFIEALKATGTGSSEVLFPGELEARNVEARRARGITISPDVVAALAQVAPSGLPTPTGMENSDKSEEVS
ncbi:Malate/lactate/ureidoglycolate dehydrogenase, LDH2 family [Amycolatopsis marina]|uniref:Malate/lactate/ureidoglycolate dehydrogenase, LDH2 family n=1 Tax=Amycolatopsis marina TaxID=490629 RepID=A0A1I1BTL3_9PSEU|nr:Ldh family oxidoreductase [Amycolatopsis marina]SFB53745.1 Malate/lactate/ureidoglycolate dehydrogenase, LDH2 family [Amycolatopsis marina]